MRPDDGGTRSGRRLPSLSSLQARAAVTDPTSTSTFRAHLPSATISPPPVLPAPTTSHDSPDGEERRPRRRRVRPGWPSVFRNDRELTLLLHLAVHLRPNLHLGRCSATSEPSRGLSGTRPSDLELAPDHPNVLPRATLARDTACAPPCLREPELGRSCDRQAI
jgi:hypothetical protein